ncbi:MAG: hypothetical protein IIA49_05475 [Bacteroidetes bacterium]|nr:hypothetical protein [Bacteroidota bacterium]
MKKTILITILLTILLAATTYAQQNLFLIDFTIDKNDEINVERFFTIDGNPRSQDLRSEYSAKMYAGKKLLYFTDFFVDFEIDDSDSELEQTYITLKFPSDRLADKLIIYKNENILETILLKDHLCNEDNVCSGYESHLNCPSDCSSGSADNYCDKVNDNICDPDCSAEEDADCSGTTTKESDLTNFSLIIIIALTIIFIIIFFIILESHRLNYKKHLDEQYRQERLSEIEKYILTNLNKGLNKKQIKNTLYKTGFDNKEIDEVLRNIK